MDRNYIRSNAVALRYLSGKLSDEESRAFEAACAADPALLDELDTDFRLKAGMERLAERGELDERLAGTNRNGGNRRYLAAASVAAIVGVATSMYLGLRVESERRVIDRLESTVSSLSAPKVLASVQRVLRTRSDRTDVRLPEAGWLGLSLDAAELAGMDVLLELRREGEGGDSAVRLDVRVPQDGTVFVAVDATQLRPGNYAVSMTPRAAGGAPPAAVVYRLRMLRTP